MTAMDWFESMYGVGEVDLLLALVGDGHGRSDDVELAARLELGMSVSKISVLNTTSRPSFSGDGSP